MKQTSPLVLSIISGLLMAISWPTVGFPIFFFFAFIPLLWIERNITNSSQKRKGLRVFGLSYISFFIFNAWAVRWLFGLEESAFFGYFFPVLANTLLMSLVFVLFHQFKKTLGTFIGYLSLVLLWISFEKLHLEWALSFPWLNLGNTFAHTHTWVQWYEYTGTLGGTLWIWIVNLAFFTILITFKKTTKGIENALKYTVLSSLLIIIPISFSLFLYNTYEETGDSIKVGVLQPNLNPYSEKFESNLDNQAILAKQLVALSDSLPNDLVYIVSPETSLTSRYPILINTLNEDSYLQLFKELQYKKPFTTFVLGSLLRDDYPYNEAPENARKNNLGEAYVIYNGAIQLSPVDPIQVYKKSKLVIGVETFPFSEYIQGSFLKEIMLDLGGTVSTFGTQDKRTPFISNKLQTGVAICYESDYGEFVSEFAKNGAQFLCVITNDGWWSNTDGHKQHLEFSKLRAIENRRAVARSANTGISCFINQKGDVLSQLAYEKTGSLVDSIVLNTTQTFYTENGDYISRISILLLGIIVAFFLYQRFKINQLFKKKR